MVDVLISEARSGEQLGSGRLLVGDADLYVAEYALEPGTEPGIPHYHREHADSFYVLEGTVEFQIEGHPTPAGPGTMVVARRGAVHAFPVAVGGPARFLNLHTPGGFERYMREMIALRERGERPSDELLRSHDIYEV